MGGLGRNPIQVKSPVVASAVSKHRVVVATANESEVDAPGGANASSIVGITQESQDTVGDPVPVTTAGIEFVEAASAIDPGDMIRIAGTGGKVETSSPATGVNDFLVGQALGKAGADGDVIPVQIQKSVFQGE